MVTTSALLTGTNLEFSYGNQTVFSGVNVEIKEREIVSLIGASGSGKSTLLRLLAGLASPNKGEINLASHDGRNAVATSYVFQTPGLLPWLTVKDNVGFGLNFKARKTRDPIKDEEHVIRSLKNVGLIDHLDKKPSQLSGGMAQRVALARALARNPDVIFLDEPFSALDAITRESMQDLLLELVHQQKSAALLVTHDIDEALRLSDRVMLLAGTPARIVGEWVPDGSAPRLHRSNQLNIVREEILAKLAEPESAWYPQI